MKESKKFYFIIYTKFKEGSYPTKLARELKMTKQNLEYYFIPFKKQGIIRKIGKGVWEVVKELTNKDIQELIKNRSKKNLSLGTTNNKPKTNIHSFQIKFPILEGIVRDSDWEVKERLKHWIPKYKKINNLGGLTLKNNNNKSISIWIKSRGINNLEEVNILADKVKIFIYEYFMLKHNVILDLENCQVKNMHLATEDINSESRIRKGERFELDLNKKAEKIFPKDNRNSKAWIDGSPYKFTAETNDLEWKREYLGMPFRMRNMEKAIIYVAENYASHVKMVEKGSNVFDRLDELLKKLNAKLEKMGTQT